LIFLSFFSSPLSCQFLLYFISLYFILFYFILFYFIFLDTRNALMALVALTTSHSSDCAFAFFLLSLFRRWRKNNQIIVVTAQAAQPSLIARSIENDRWFRLLKRPLLPQQIKRKSVRRKSATINSESSSYSATTTASVSHYANKPMRQGESSLNAYPEPDPFGRSPFCSVLHLLAGVGGT